MLLPDELDIIVDGLLADVRKVRIMFPQVVYATFQNGRNKFDAYDTGEYFVISHATLVTETEDVDMLVTFNELIKICMQNGWEIDYTYKM